MKNKQEDNIKLYNEVLSEKEIVTIGLIIRRFEREQITYHQLKQLIKEENIELTPRFRDVSKAKMTVMQAEEMKRRFEREEYDPGDVNGYLISGKNYENVLIRYDRPMIEVLAKNGDEDAIITRDFLVDWEEKHRFAPNNRKKK